jgi:hypothetical protein
MLVCTYDYNSISIQELEGGIADFFVDFWVQRHICYNFNLRTGQKIKTGLEVAH